MPSFILTSFLWHFPDELSIHFLFTLVLFKFLYFLLFKFFTRYSIFSIDCLSVSNSLEEIFFRIGNIKTQTVFLFSAATFHTHLCIPLSSLCTTCPHRSSGVTLHTLPLFSLISCPHLSLGSSNLSLFHSFTLSLFQFNLSIHYLSTVVFLLRI